MTNPDVEAPPAPAEETAPANANVNANTAAAASGVGKVTLASFLLIAVPALVIGSVALARTNSTSARQSTPSSNIDVDLAHHGGGATKKTKKSGDEALTPEIKEDSDSVSILDDVIATGTLKCGVIPVIGFADNSTGTWVGMDADLCRAVAAGVGVDVEFVPTTFPDRWIDLQSGRFDLLSAYTTHTMERDVYQESVGKGFCFSEPYFYDGATYAGIPEAVACLDSITGDNVFEEAGGGADCSAVKVCVEAGTTTIDAVRKILPEDNVVEATDLEAAYQGLIDGVCNVIAGGRAEVAQPSAVNNGFSDEDSYAVGTNLLLRDPLAMVTRDDDRRWCDVIFWTHQALVAAEEQGIAQSTASDLTVTVVFGESLDDIFVEAVRAVGNYGEVYARNVEAIIPRSGLDLINAGDSGRLYSLPFGSLSVEGVNPLDFPESTIAKIHQRGHLRCGITRRASFAELNPETLEFEGYDVDFCKAISAAIFDGPVDNIVFVDLLASNRFEYLARGTVDVLSRFTTHTLERDVDEPTTGVGFSFTVPNYYDGLRFGGIPPYAQCANNVDVESEECIDLRICTDTGTTNEVGVRKLFPQENIVITADGLSALRGLTTGECNVVAGGSHNVAQGSVESVGYFGPYEVGTNVFAKDPLAIVTREDDPMWSDFVYWILQATIYAEEQGITQQTAATEMPLTNLFGDLFTRMLQNAVQAAGNIGENTARNVERLVPRAGLNTLNDEGGPQLYALPGI